MNHAEERYRKLEELLFKLRRARWLHRRAASFYRPRQVTLIALAFIISESIGVLGIASKDANDDNNKREIIGYFIAISSVLNGFLTLISDTLGYRTKINSNKLAAQAYDLLITQVNFELQFPSQVPIKEFAASIEEEIIKIKNNYKVIPEQRFEREVNDFIKKGGDISSDAGFTPKASFISNLRSKLHRTKAIVTPESFNPPNTAETTSHSVTRIQVEPYNPGSVNSSSSEVIDIPEERPQETSLRSSIQLSPFSIQRDLRSLRLKTQESDDHKGG